MNTNPDFILFAQHGWADTCHTVEKLAKTLATPQTLVIAPNLGFLETWLRIEPLIKAVEQIALNTITHYPDIPIRIIGHSMGGLIWLEVLNRHPEWWTKIESLILIASPVGGADLACLIDPLGIGIGIARDLGINRRTIAEQIAQAIPTLIIAGDIDQGSDGTITVGTTKFNHSKFVCVSGISHSLLKNHPSLIEIIREFWKNPTINIAPEPDATTLLIQRLQAVTGMTDAHQRDFQHSKVLVTFKNGMTIRTWKHPLQFEHIFVADSAGECLYSGFVSWLHTQTLRQVLQEIQQEEEKEMSGTEESIKDKISSFILSSIFGTLS